MSKSKWMWAPKAFELYHGAKLNNRRTMSGEYYPPMWRIDGPSRNLFLYKTAVLENEETVVLHANTKDAAIRIDGGIWNTTEVEIKIPAGKHMVKVTAYKDGGFPAVYVEGDVFASDESWNLGSYGLIDAPAGTNDMYTELADDPEIFKFAYKRITPVCAEKVDGGTLFDFGKESFGKLILENITYKNAEFIAYCGESREEALDCPNAIVWIKVKAENGAYVSDAVAFRYVFVPDFGGEYTLEADFEYLPVEKQGDFSCEDELVNKIYDVAVYTLGLNTREGFLDGIKRDRWVWGGDAYQSFLANYYLNFDLDSVRRTLRILRGCDPIGMHVNTIPDYTFYWIISLWEYYMYTGDKRFMLETYHDMCTLFDFAESRFGEDGLYKKGRGDWVFVDWAENFDKDAGPMCAEQMLLCHAYECAMNCAILVGDEKNAARYKARAAETREKINSLYWDEEKCAFVDDFRSGNRNVTRHANIFSILYDLTTEQRKSEIIEKVIKNDKIPAIVTPYFKFFELAAMCEIGDFAYVSDMLRSYWGGMLKEGATSFWEKYEPDMHGAEHYEMYGKPYGKSLCHAWGGTTPLYLLGKYVLGVRPTDVSYKTFEVRPCTKDIGMSSFSGIVPTPRGNIEVKVSDNSVCVIADMDGGTLIVGNEKYSIEAGKALEVRI